MKNLAQAALTAVLTVLFALILLVLFAGKSSAQTIATAPTKTGGEIRLMIDDCPRTELPDAKKRMAAYIRTADNKMILGCWIGFDGQAEVDFIEIGKRFYPYTGFTMTPFGDRLMKLHEERKNQAPQRGITGNISTL